jgi:hypothetical protein
LIRPIPTALGGTQFAIKPALGEPFVPALPWAKSIPLHNQPFLEREYLPHRIRPKKFWKFALPSSPRFSATPLQHLDLRVALE